MPRGSRGEPGAAGLSAAGARATAERVLVLTSSQQALSLCAQVLLDPGDRIVVEDPAYYGARKAFDAAGLECLPARVDRQGLLVERIAAEPRKARAVFLTPSHQFPTGATLALDVFINSVRHYLGAYLVELGGADAIVFTGGIGENSVRIRTGVCRDLDWFGISLDPGLNVGGPAERRVSAEGSRVQVWTVPTNEELGVARQSRDLLRSGKNSID